MSEIQVSCNDQVLKITKAPVIASGGLNEVTINFTFCEKWDGFIKTALFYRDEEEIYYAVLQDDSCTVPWEVCYLDGYFYFSVFGEKKNARRTSNTTRYKVVKGAITEGFLPSDPTPEVYDQIIAMIGEMKESQGTFIVNGNAVIEEAREQAQNAFNASARANVAANNAEQATNNAQTATANANNATNSANTAASGANTAANNANTAAENARTATQEISAFLENAENALETIQEIVQDGEDATPIVCTAEGKTITANDSADRMLRGLTVYGKTTQDGTPTPSNPIELVSVGNSGAINFTVESSDLTTQGLTISTPNGLPGIKLGATIPDVIANSPAHMSGVYKDKETQTYWIGNTKDGASGKNVQRIGKITIDENYGNISINEAGTTILAHLENYALYEFSETLCNACVTANNPDDYANATICARAGNSGAYIYFKGFGTLDELKGYCSSIPIIVQYILATPIETDLSAEEKAAFAALRSNKPTTTVYNDAGAHQKIAYIADTKAYMDNKFAELAAAIVNNV